MKFTVVATSVVGVVSHGSMTHPRPRNALSSPATAGSYGSDFSCAGDACYWYQVGCQIGCPSCILDLDSKGCGTGNECCSKSEGLMEPTNNDPEFRSWDPYGEAKNPDQHKYNPWRAPGKAPVTDPCGVASGGTNPGAYAAVPAGYSGGDLALQVLPEQDATLWTAGGVAQVGWGLSAQHSGGYSYRLCPKNSVISEECFQSNTLTFAGDDSKIHFNDGSQSDKTITTKTYVAPDGTQWRRNPIPACNYNTNHGRATPSCPSGTMFEPGFDEFTQGFIRPDASGGKNHFSIMDDVNVPNKPGSYLLSWRWDCEEADQVWTSCADIEIVDGSVPAPTPPPVEPDATCSSSQSCAKEIGSTCVECCPGNIFIYNSQSNICYGVKTEINV